MDTDQREEPQRPPASERSHQQLQLLPLHVAATEPAKQAERHWWEARRHVLAHVSGLHHRGAELLPLRRAALGVCKRAEGLILLAAEVLVARLRIMILPKRRGAHAVRKPHRPQVEPDRAAPGVELSGRIGHSLHFLRRAQLRQARQVHAVCQRRLGPCPRGVCLVHAVKEPHRCEARARVHQARELHRAVGVHHMPRRLLQLLPDEVGVCAATLHI
mmetsp:Transcript_113927/g.317236  ORF Transcript_113927/g.317236 Transcript_113927/m.317236 type:complete len:217 (+) Transcript_113927:75-725(+)